LKSFRNGKVEKGKEGKEKRRGGGVKQVEKDAGEWFSQWDDEQLATFYVNLTTAALSGPNLDVCAASSWQVTRFLPSQPLQPPPLLPNLHVLQPPPRLLLKRVEQIHLRVDLLHDWGCFCFFKE